MFYQLFISTDEIFTCDVVGSVNSKGRLDGCCFNEDLCGFLNCSRFRRSVGEDDDDGRKQDMKSDK